MGAQQHIVFWFLLSVLSHTGFGAFEGIVNRQRGNVVVPSLNKDALLRNSKVDSCSSQEEKKPWRMPLVNVEGTQYYIGHFFKANWFKAAEYCRYHGMHLASITSKEQNDALEKIINDQGLGREHFWTSGTDLGEEDKFVWFGLGERVTFTNWNAGEPNNFRYENGEEEHCLELWNRDGKGLKWNDTPCSFETYFLCQL